MAAVHRHPRAVHAGRGLRRDAAKAVLARHLHADPDGRLGVPRRAPRSWASCSTLVYRLRLADFERAAPDRAAVRPAAAGASGIALVGALLARQVAAGLDGRGPRPARGDHRPADRAAGASSSGLRVDRRPRDPGRARSSCRRPGARRPCSPRQHPGPVGRILSTASCSWPPGQVAPISAGAGTVSYPYAAYSPTPVELGDHRGRAAPSWPCSTRSPSATWTWARPTCTCSSASRGSRSTTRPRRRTRRAPRPCPRCLGVPATCPPSCGSRVVIADRLPLRVPHRGRARSPSGSCVVGTLPRPRRRAGHGGRRRRGTRPRRPRHGPSPRRGPPWPSRRWASRCRPTPTAMAATMTGRAPSAPSRSR